MAENFAAAGGGGEEEAPVSKEVQHVVTTSRKEKRKAAKKQKRKQIRKEAALKEIEAEEARMNDPEEQMRTRLMEEEEAQRAERERKEFEERERLWLEAMEKKKKEEEDEEEERRKALEESEKNKVENHDELDEDDEWMYVEEGPAEIIWEGNEITVKKKTVKVAKKDAPQLRKEDTDRPTSNPLPPQSEAFSGCRNVPHVSTQQAYDNVAQQIPNFGTEQDKDHCPFHFKTGACRFGTRCSRVHFYPDKSCTLLIKNMYNGPGLAWEQDEGLEVCKWCHHAIHHTDEEVDRCYEEFYEDVHTEFLKFGELVNFKVCKNGSSHLRGNVYIHYKSLDSALMAYHSINGRYFAGKQLTCEFVGVTRWKVAICGEYMKSKLKTCSRGTTCNFIHCFCNPGSDYDWANWDKPAPRYWAKKMAALFGYLDECPNCEEMESESFRPQKNSSRTTTQDTNRYDSRRSRSSGMSPLAAVNSRRENQAHTSKERSRGDDRRRRPYKENSEDNHCSKGYFRKSSKRRHEVAALQGEYDSEESESDRDVLDDRKRISKHQDDKSSSATLRKTRMESPDSFEHVVGSHEEYSYEDCSVGGQDSKMKSSFKRKRLKHHIESFEAFDGRLGEKRTHDSNSESSKGDVDRDRHMSHVRRRSLGYQSKDSRLRYDYNCKNKNHDKNSDVYRSQWDRDDKNWHNCRREISKQQNQVLADDPNYRTSDSGVNDNLSDKDRDRNHSDKRKRKSDSLTRRDSKKSKDTYQHLELDSEEVSVKNSRRRHSKRKSSSSMVKNDPGEESD